MPSDGQIRSLNPLPRPTYGYMAKSIDDSPAANLASNCLLTLSHLYPGNLGFLPILGEDCLRIPPRLAELSLACVSDLVVLLALFQLFCLSLSFLLAHVTAAPFCRLSKRTIVFWIASGSCRLALFVLPTRHLGRDIVLLSLCHRCSLRFHCRPLKEILRVRRRSD